MKLLCLKLIGQKWIKERLKAAEEALDERKRKFVLDHGGSRDENEAIETRFVGSAFCEEKQQRGTWIVN